MRAMVVRSPGDVTALRLEDVSTPELEADEALIRTEACGVCFHDIVTRNGVMKRGIVLPVIPGHEIAGEITEVGSDVTGFRVGELVATAQRRRICGHCRLCRTGRETACEEREFLGDVGLNGGYAEFVAVGQDNLASVPEGVSVEQAAIAACAVGTELNAIRDVATVRMGERCLLNGAGGGLGVHGVQLAKLAGAVVIAVTTTEQKVETILDAGADVALLVERGEDFSGRVKEITDGAGVDVAIDNVGSPTFHAVRRSLAVGARWVFVGQVTGDFVELNPAQVFARDITIMSTKSTSREQLVDALNLIARGDVKPVISHTYALDEAPDAHAEVESGRAMGRVLIKPQL